MYMGLLDKLLKKKQTSEKDKAEKKSDEVKVTLKEEETGGAEKNEGKVRGEVKQIRKQDNRAAVKKSRRLSEDSLAYEILVSPLITEKSAVAESINKYSFVVARWATKNQIARVMREVYGIKPTKVQTANITGHCVRFKGISGLRQDYKKAIITLPKGKSIDIHKGV